MKKTIFRAVVALALLFVTLPAATLAGEGRTPIWEPTVITASGKYVVTRNIVTPGGPPIITIAARNVDIDLNGFTVGNGPSADPVILADSVDNVAVRNGTVGGGASGISMSRGSHFIVEDVRVSSGGGPGIELMEMTDFAVRRAHISDRDIGIIATAPAGSETTGTLVDNDISRCSSGIAIESGSSVIVKHNRLEDLFGSFGIFVVGSFGVLLSENTVQDAAAQGMWIESSFACKLHNNVILRSRLHGIELAGTFDSLLLDNVVSQSAAEGILVGGERNHLERNVTNLNGTGGAGFGVLFLGAGNVYRGNSAFGNTGAPCAGFPATPDICDAPAANLSIGDNFMPFLL